MYRGEVIAKKKKLNSFEDMCVAICNLALRKCKMAQ